MKTTDRKTRPASSAGQEMLEGLREFRDALAEEAKIEEKFTVRTVTLDLETTPYDAASFRHTRARLRASQSIFAKLLGVSPKLVQAIEQGSKDVSGPLSRLLDEINADPQRWIERFLVPRKGRARTVCRS